MSKSAWSHVTTKVTKAMKIVKSKRRVEFYPDTEFKVSMTESGLQPNAWGELRFAREDQMRAQYAADRLARGEISEAQFAKLSKPWHANGVSPENPNWDRSIDEKAKKIRKKKDAELLKAVEDFEAGRIDENGNPITQEESIGKCSEEVVEGKKEEKEEEEEEDEDSDIDILPPPKPKKSAAPIDKGKGKEKERKISSSRISKPANTPKASKATPTISKPASWKTPKSPPVVVPMRPRASYYPPDDAPLPDYKAYGYYQLVALCRFRGLSSGDGTDVIRVRLMRDDVCYRNGTERDSDDACAYVRSEEKMRLYVTGPPVLNPNATLAPTSKTTSSKRKCDGHEDEDEEAAGKGEEKKAKA